MKKTILHLVIAKTWGGGEQYVYDVCREIKKRGYEAFVLVDKSNVKFQKIYKEVANVLTANLYSLGGLFGLIEIIPLIRKYKINIINCHSGHALLACILLKKFTDVKVVMFKHNAIAIKNDYYHQWQRLNVDAYICVSRLVYELQVNTLHSVERQKFHLVYNGIDIDKFNRYEFAQFRDTNYYAIGYAGRLTQNKGIDVLIKALSNIIGKYPNMVLYLAGPDERNCRIQLEQLVYKLNLSGKVEFLGQVQDMEKFYKSLDLFILPSVVKESFGLVICEALYCGLPVITTDSGAQKEILKDKNTEYGVVVKSGSVNELSSAMEKMYLDKNFIQSKGKEYVKNNFSIKRCVEEILQIYEGL